jgi:hypothetical protein
MTTTESVSQGVAIRWYLGISPSPSRISCFVAAIRDAREFTGRVPDTGAKLPGGNHGCWLGALGYMALLDQVGSCLKPKDKNEDGNEIKKSLKYFSSLRDPEIEAIYALRCAFAHNYSLVNVNRRRQARQHVFTLCQGDTASLVGLPRVPWRGAFDAVNADNRTVVNLEAFGDLVESVRISACEQATRDNLEITLAGGVDELLVRYFFIVRQGTS